MGLKAELGRLRQAKSFGNYIDHRVANKAFFQSVSEAGEQALQFMRRYVSYTFPRSLITISNIEAEAMCRNGRKEVGDYALFAARAGSLFMNANLLALDEYGIPAETARRLALSDVQPETLDRALALVVATDTSATSNLHRSGAKLSVI